MKKFNVKDLGEKIKYLRKEAGLGQNQLAEYLEVSNASISYWETGKQIPSAEAIFKLSVFFNVPSDYLLNIDD